MRRRRRNNTRARLFTRLERLEPRLVLSGLPLITELMADNASTLQDEDGRFSDWIEIHNPDPADIDLSGWYLTDTAADLTRWEFPAVMLPGGGHLLVFASGRDRTVGQLHTNFDLEDTGEFLALVKPDGSTVVSRFDPFPAALPDVAYGLSTELVTDTVLAPGAAARVLIPQDDIPARPLRAPKGNAARFARLGSVKPAWRRRSPAIPVAQSDPSPLGKPAATRPQRDNLRASCPRGSNPP